MYQHIKKNYYNVKTKIYYKKYNILDTKILMH